MQLRKGINVRCSEVVVVVVSIFIVSFFATPCSAVFIDVPLSENNSLDNWIPWNEPASDGGRIITTAELQEIIYYWLNEMATPETGSNEPVIPEPESAPQANINVIVFNQSSIKLMHLGGDTIILNDNSTTVLRLTREDGASFELDAIVCTDPFDVGTEMILPLMNGNFAVKMNVGEIVNFQMIDVKTNQLIVDKDLRF